MCHSDSQKKYPFFFLSGSVLITGCLSFFFEKADFLTLVGFFCELIVAASELTLRLCFPVPLDVEAIFTLSLLSLFKRFPPEHSAR
jgi:hypothetical protein